MAITPLPEAPLRSMSPAGFEAAADSFLGALPTFVTEANALANAVGNDATSASASASTATTQADSATASAASAVAAANFKGIWSNLSGALNVPASVLYGTTIWLLNTNVANVATAVPGVSSSWTPLGAIMDHQSAIRAGVI